MSEPVKTVRTIPTTMVTGYWESDSSQYPDRIKVVMADGKRVTYRIDIEQPHPQCVKSLELIQIMKKHIYGGNGYQAKHEKK